MTATDISQTTRLMVVSADGHAGPLPPGYRPFVAAKHLGRFEEYLAMVEAYDAELAETLAARAGEDRHPFTRMADERNRLSGLWDPDVRVRDMDAEGISGEVVFPQGAIPFARYPALSDPRRPRISFEPDAELRNAGPRIYNRWLAELCAANPGRHAGIAVVPIRDVDATVAEVRWARAAGLAGGISLPPISADYPMYNDAVYEPFWAACQDHDMPLNIHGGGDAPFYGSGPESIALILAESDFWSRRALAFLIFGGVFDRYPRLKVAITETRAGWVPSYCAMLDSIFHSHTTTMRHVLARSPSEYFASNCYVGASFMSQQEADLRYETGVDRIMWGADYPHIEGSWPWSGPSLRKTFAGVPTDELKLMIGENAVRCYGLDVDALRKVADRIGPTADELAVTLDEIPSPYNWAFRQEGDWN
jgi:predicted TIM-barrel fold metal-dependent hydrolase